MVNLKINNIPVSVPEGTTVLDAARKLNIEIPTLCFLRDINEIGACRMCLVEVKGARGFVTSCVYPVTEGMEVFTNTPDLRKARKLTLELILSNHDKKCLSCPRSGSCELQKLCKDYGVEDADFYKGENPETNIDESAAHMVRNNNKCILCRRCIAACTKMQGIGVIGANDRGFDTHIGCAFDKDLADVACVSCGQCIVACPTGALTEKDGTKAVWDAISDPEKVVVFNTAPSIRATLGECFGMPVGTDVTGKMVAAIRRLGGDKVFDTDFAADLTIMEEATEFLDRVKNGGTLPLITSCSPGWIKYCEYFYPEFIPNLSSCKSPQQMFGAVIKNVYAKAKGIDPKNIFVVSVMPCTAKKFEIGRDDQASSGYPDTDCSITTRELGNMIKAAGIDFENLADEKFDDDLGLGVSTGAATIFGATGGVMEAALRTATHVLTGGKGSLEFVEVRGTEGFKEATYNVAGMEVKVAVVSGTANAKKVLDLVKSGEKNYHFIEVMGCPGGCVNGGGQPIQPASVRNFTDLKALRAKVLYDSDKADIIRTSHDNPAVKKLYEDYLEKPGSHKAHEILHTSYVKREENLF